MNAIETIKNLLDPTVIRTGDPVVSGAVGLVPIFHDLPAADYVRFGELPDDAVIVTEVDSMGQVPELLVVNAAPRPVLFLEGEVLLGLKQDRTLNITVLVPAHSEVRLPVACVEQGRWSNQTSYASRGNMHLPPRARYDKTLGTQRSVRTDGRYHTDQGAVWDAVEYALNARDVSSPSGAFRDAAAVADADYSSPLELQPLTDQRGVIAFIGGRPVAADIFDRHETLCGSWTGLLHSYVGDALRVEDNGEVERESADAVLAGLARASASIHAGVGAGRIVQLTRTRAVASALVADGTVVHLAALWDQNRRPGPDPGLQTRRPSRRRSWQSTLDRNSQKN